MSINVKGLKTFIRPLSKCVSKHLPELAIAAGIGGMGFALYSGIKGGVKADKIKTELKKENPDISKAEIVRSCWKCYAPAALIFLTSAASIVGGTTVNLKRTASLSAVAAITETAYTEFKDAVKQKFGEEIVTETENDIDSRKLRSKEPELREAKAGNCLFFEPLTGRLFESTVNDIDREVNRLNKCLLSDDLITHDEFCQEISNGELTGANLGEYFGWDISNGLIDVSYTGDKTVDNVPCLRIFYNNPPRYLNYY